MHVKRYLYNLLKNCIKKVPLHFRFFSTGPWTWMWIIMELIGKIWPSHLYCHISHRKSILYCLIILLFNTILKTIIYIKNSGYLSMLVFSQALGKVKIYVKKQDLTEFEAVLLLCYFPKIYLKDIITKYSQSYASYPNLRFLSWDCTKLWTFEF